MPKDWISQLTPINILACALWKSGQLDKINVKAEDLKAFAEAGSFTIVVDILTTGQHNYVKFIPTEAGTSDG